MDIFPIVNRKFLNRKFFVPSRYAKVKIALLTPLLGIEMHKNIFLQA